MIDPAQRRFAAAALAVTGEHGFALAGGLALAAHGVGARPSDDVDLFTANTDPDAFAAGVEAVHQVFRARGWAVREERRGPLYARIVVDIEPGGSYELDLAVDYRARPPVALADEREVHPLDRRLLADRLRQGAHLPERDLRVYLDAAASVALRSWFVEWADAVHDAR